jgi:hypothetical protein
VLWVIATPRREAAQTRDILGIGHRQSALTVGGKSRRVAQTARRGALKMRLLRDSRQGTKRPISGHVLSGVPCGPGIGWSGFGRDFNWELEQPMDWFPFLEGRLEEPDMPFRYAFPAYSLRRRFDRFPLGTLCIL